MVPDLGKAPLVRVSVLLIIAVTLFSPGMLWLLVFWPELFFRADTVRLLGLSAGIAWPVFVTNASLAAGLRTPSANEGTHERERRESFLISSGGLLSLLPLYVPIAQEVIFGIGGFGTAVFLGVIVQAAIAAFVIWLAKQEQRPS